MAQRKYYTGQFKAKVAIVVGVVSPSGTEYYHYGGTAAKGDQNVDEETIFEIGSITKIFGDCSKITEYLALWACVACSRIVAKTKFNVWIRWNRNPECAIG